MFPLLTATGAVLLLTHNHAIANVKEQLLIELSHTPLALGGRRRRLVALARDCGPTGNVRRWAGWVWPTCLVLVGADPAQLPRGRHCRPPTQPAFPAVEQVSPGTQSLKLIRGAILRQSGLPQSRLGRMELSAGPNGER